ncbi:hypothetical protein VI817_007854 [Penicillium citrinum]|nr:hypothetical protein VI817_007854 [Penicillium citrinum]
MTDPAENAMNGERKFILHYKFEIETDMVMEFEGASCNIADADGNILDTLGPEHGKTERLLHAGSRCYVLKAYIKFVKKSTE